MQELYIFNFRRFSEVVLFSDICKQTGRMTNINASYLYNSESSQKWLNGFALYCTFSAAYIYAYKCFYVILIDGYQKFR